MCFAPNDDCPDIFSGVPVAERLHSDTLLLTIFHESDICAMLYGVAVSFGQTKKRVKVFGFLSKCRINGCA